MQPRQVYLNICHLKTISLLAFFLILLNKLPFLGPLGSKTMRLTEAKTFSADWLHLVDTHGYLCPYKIPAFWGIVWVMVLVTVGKCYSYDDHQNKSMYKNRHRVVMLFVLFVWVVFFFFEKWTFLHQQKNWVSKLHGCQMADIFVAAYHNLDVNFWHKDGCN